MKPLQPNMILRGSYSGCDFSIECPAGTTLDDILTAEFWKPVLGLGMVKQFLQPRVIVRAFGPDNSFDVLFVVLALRAADRSPLLRLFPYEGGASIKRHPAKSERSQALEVLGLKEDATDAIIKTVGDALRKTHHPDHAVDEADRITRTEMMKAINHAIDILTGKRAAA
jgi:sulfur carrier protein ThiS